MSQSAAEVPASQSFAGIIKENATRQYTRRESPRNSVNSNLKLSLARKSLNHVFRDSSQCASAHHLTNPPTATKFGTGRHCDYALDNPPFCAG